MIKFGFRYQIESDLDLRAVNPRRGRFGFATFLLIFSPAFPVFFSPGASLPLPCCSLGGTDASPGPGAGAGFPSWPVWATRSHDIPCRSGARTALGVEFHGKACG